VGVVDGLAVDEELLVPDLHRVAPHRDDPLDEVLRFVLGVDEDGDVAAPGLADGDDRVAQVGELDPVAELVHQDVIADLEGRLHGARGDLEGLDDKGADEGGDQDGDDDRLGVLPDLRGFRVRGHDAFVFLTSRWP